MPDDDLAAPILVLVVGVPIACAVLILAALIGGIRSFVEMF